MSPPPSQRSLELEESYRVWSGRIHALQKDHDRETDSERRFNLVERLAEAMRYRDELTKHLTALEQGEAPPAAPAPGSLLAEALQAGARLSPSEVPATFARPAAPTLPPGTQAPGESQADAFAFDVFISYSHADEEWVEHTLLPTLERAGLRVCVDFRDFVAGKPALLNMQDAVKTSRHTLLILTEHWVASQWTLYEAILARTKDPAGLQRRTIPVRLEACDLPESISMLTWVDFTRPARHEIAWRQLLTAVGRPPAQQTVEPPTPAGWHLAHPYAMPPNFTGRLAERAELTQWLEQDGEHPLLVIRALGGFGKSALAWHWLHHDVDAARWPRVVWWSFYEPEASFERFLAETLAYLGVDPRRFPGPRQQADALLNILRQPGTLLLLDGFERALRAYSSLLAAYQGDEVAGEQVAGGTLQVAGQQVASGQASGAGTPSGINHSPFTNSPINHSHLDCVSPVAEHFLRSLASLPGLRGKVLMTTRLTPRVLQGHDGDLLLGCREVELTQMQPADALAFLRSQGIRGGRAEIEAACAAYGYHPLSLRILAGWIKRDMQQPGDIAAARRLDVSGSLVQRQHHVLATAYNSLAPAQQQLLSRIACFRGPVGYEALAAIQKPGFSSATPGSPGELPVGNEQVRDDKRPGFSEGALDAALHDLIERGLLHRDLRTNRFDLHPIVRRYAYDRLGGDARGETHARLRDYFAAVPPPDKVQTLDDLAPAIEQYHHTLAAGQYDEAYTLFVDRINQATYYQFGAYQMQIELLRGLFPNGEDEPPRLTKESDQAWTLNEMANSYGLSGQPRRAVPLCEQAARLDESKGDKEYLAIDLGNLADDQAKIGAMRAAEANLHRQIELCREIGDEFHEMIGHGDLGRLNAYRGQWIGSTEEQEVELKLAKKLAHVQRQGISWAYCALRALLLMRDASPGPDLPTAALHAAQRVLELADEDARTVSPVARDYVRAHWLLGAAHRVNGDSDAADRHLLEALTRCRSINMVDHEAAILLDLARLWRDQAQAGGSFGQEPQNDRMTEALRLAEEALLITERSGYVLQGADVRLLLAQMALDAGDRSSALEHARLARQLATCDGPPDYTYKVAYEEAGAMVAALEAIHE
ncbi:MAG TPA: TIR domain-containing protein [Anaerolineae bacterium]|nr:TIR domain-containing protein [Anaerolineae bacterium]